MSYSIDVYKKKLEPTKNFIAFAAFVAFFPQLVAGPIERAAKLLPQFYIKRVFNYEKASDGCKQILWGFFKKMVIADNCAVYVNMVFDHYKNYSGSTLLLGAVLFAFQIYGDFSGYSDIAIGTSKLFGVTLMKNFAFPYFSRDMAEFWRRWHISLTTWFRDYVYIPLGGSKRDTLISIRNTFIIFLVSGFWHGANWTFIAWGFINALYFLPLMLLKRNRQNKDTAAAGKTFPGFKELVSIISTFFLTVIGWIFFRSYTIRDSAGYLAKIFSKTIFKKPAFNIVSKYSIVGALISIIILISIEWINRDEEYGLKKLPKSKLLRWVIIIGITMVIVELGGAQQEFIYFQF
ncbi:MBOAT family O-acyltransferase [Treponema primitia]|uniref:MBOAT family O-acyltransferase n=1 Tax=Treponema primitia TaxID=88058 RepID=UPI0018E11668|nr:MBOAT family protein [Treponema primitia]